MHRVSQGGNLPTVPTNQLTCIFQFHFSVTPPPPLLARSLSSRPQHFCCSLLLVECVKEDFTVLLASGCSRSLISILMPILATDTCGLKSSRTHSRSSWNYVWILGSYLYALPPVASASRFFFSFFASECKTECRMFILCARINNEQHSRLHLEKTCSTP